MAIKDDIRPTEAGRSITEEADFLTIKDVDHIELWVGNAYQAAQFWQHTFGFKRVAYSGLETGNRQTASHVLQQGKIRLVVTGSYRPDSEVAAHHLIHGDGVKVVAFQVDDVEQAFAATVERGAEPIQSPTTLKDDHGVLRTAMIATYGDTVHRLVERDDYAGVFMPGYEAREPLENVPEVGLAHVDHIVGNVQLGKMNYWVNWYHRVMGFRQLLHSGCAGDIGHRTRTKRAPASGRPIRAREHADNGRLVEQSQ